MLALLLVSAVLLAWTRLLLWQRRAREGLKSRGWRLALLIALQPICAGLLYLTLMPPAVRSGGAGELVVLTRGAPRLAPLADEARVVALPEARGRPGAELVPDLATALRRHPDAGRLRIVGTGLEARDRDAARGLVITFDPPKLPRALVEIAPPDRVAPGAEFKVGGRAEALEGGSVELLDPGGHRLDLAPLSASGRFVLTGAARVPGVALFKVRVRDARRAIADEAEVPVWTAAQQPVRILLLAGSPSAEIKYLRRWANDAGLAVTTRIAAGGGIDLGDAVPPLSPATLARFDLAILDERSWSSLGGGERGALAAAQREGLGILLRVDGPLSGAARAGWRTLGLPLAGDAATAPVALRSPEGVAIPLLTRYVLTVDGGDAVPMVRDADGAVLASWRARGLGRVGIWTLADSFGLVPSGHGDVYGALWSSAITALARGEAQWTPRIGALPRKGQRVSLCGLTPRAEIVGPNGATTRLRLDPAIGSPCAAYWPGGAGWHLLRDGTNVRPFFVYAASAIAGAREAERRAETLRLAAGSVDGKSAGTAPARAVARGASWPWFLAFLVAGGLLAWLERNRRGRAARG
jgi:hypothetical protein